MNKDVEKAVKQMLKLSEPARIVFAARGLGVREEYWWENPPTFRVQCDYQYELEECLGVIGEINEFSPQKVKEALAEVKLWEEWRMGEVSVGIESSPVMYLSRRGESNELKEFKDKIKKFAKFTSADECNFIKVGNKITYRIWWD